MEFIVLLFKWHISRNQIQDHIHSEDIPLDPRISYGN